MNNLHVIWDGIDMIIMSMGIYSPTSSQRGRLMACYLYISNELLVHTWAILSEFAWLKNQIPNQRSWNGEMQARLVLKSTSRTPMNCKLERIESDAVRANTRMLNVQDKLLRVVYNYHWQPQRWAVHFRYFSVHNRSWRIWIYITNLLDLLVLNLLNSNKQEEDRINSTYSFQQVTDRKQFKQKLFTTLRI